MLKLFNTLSKKVEEFKPINPASVRMYSCGPTPYDYQHLGNFRSALLSDILLRVLQLKGIKVKTVRNITDIEDKIINLSKDLGITPKELTDKYTKAYFEDLLKLNILPSDENPKATEHIEKMVKYIEELIKKGLAYIKDDSVYFDISKFPDYGKLSGVEKRELKSGTRVLSDEYTKDNVQDFALWKSVKPEEVGWDSPWGRGRPGWHIECSVMSQEYLGDSFDIHTGGVDLIFPHHENEIAQAEGKTGKPFVKYFIHGEHLLVDSQKMSKSLKNTYTLKNLEEKGFEPLAFRYLCLTAHYRDKLNFTWQSLEAAQKALNNLRELIRDWDQPKIGCAGYEQDFKKALDDDLNTPQALAVMWKMVKDNSLPTSARAESLLKMDQVLGLGLKGYLGKKIEVPSEVMKLLEQRDRDRKSGDFKKSDQLRKKIRDLGFEIEDTPEGSRVK